MDLLTIDLARIEPPSLRDGEATDSEAIAALAESIARHGLIHPISVCTMLDGGSADYEVAIGARRLHALRLLDNQSRGVPVRAQVLDIEPGAVMAENTCRSDMTVWEIGEAVAAMGDAPDAVVAAAAGIAPTQVPYARRIAALQPELAELVRAGRLSLSTTLAVAALPAGAQRSLMETVNREDWVTGAADQLALDWIRSICGRLRGADLTAALWPIDEEWTDPVDPIRANACIRCPQNATAAPDLLSAERAECHDIACFDARLHSVLERRATSVDGPALEIAAHRNYKDESVPAGMRATTILGQQKRKPCSSAEKVVVGKAPYDGSTKVGDVAWSCSDPKCKKHGSGAPAAGSRNVDEAEKKRRAKAKAEGKRRYQAWVACRDAIGEATELDPWWWRQIVGMLLERMYHATRSKLLKELGVEDLPGLLEGMDSPQLQRLAAVAMLWMHAQTPHEYEVSTPPAELARAVELLGIPGL